MDGLSSPFSHLSNPDSEVIIIGAGPVGLLLANLLGQAQVRTLVCDKRDAPLESSMAIGVTPPSLEILKRLDLDRAFTSAGIPVRDAEVYEGGDKLGRLSFHQIRSEYPFFLSIPQACTVQLLRQSLRRFPSVTLHDALECSGLDPCESRVQTTLTSTKTGSTIQVTGAFLVGCDGHRSTVRAAAGLRVRERQYPQRFVMADFRDESDLGSEARLFFSPEGSVESFPLPGGWRRWIVLMGQPNNPASLQHLMRRVQTLTGLNLSRQPARFFSEFGAKRMLVDRYYSGRVLLAGDAAHVMSSVGGQGMNTGFADAELIAALLPSLLRNSDRRPAALASYDRVRRHAYQIAANRAERGMWLGTLRGRFASILRKHLIRDILFRPPLRSRLAPHFAMLTIPFRNLNHVPRELSVSL